MTAGGVKIVKISKINDICVIKKSGHGLVPLRFVADYSTIAPHVAVHVVGSPMGIYATHFDGEVISTSMAIGKDGPKMMIIDAAAAPGNSGSAVVNDQNEIVGMLVASAKDFGHLSICVTALDLKAFLK